MGMGEPLANYRRVVDAVRRITDPAPDGLGLSQRSVTVSTVGLVPAIGKLAGEGLGVTLAVSLHAPDDELRDSLVPVNTRWKVAEVLAAARSYAATTGRRVSIEYALIRGVNDQPWRAELLGSLLRGALGPHVGALLDDPAVTDVMCNADGRLFVDRTGQGRTDSGVTLTAANADYALRMLASWSGTVLTRERPVLSATMPGSGERVAGTITYELACGIDSSPARARRVVRGPG